MTESELNMMLLNYMSSYPGFSTEEIIILVQAADNSANPHGASGDYKFKEGDIILLDFCAYYNGYWSDITRCLFVGYVGHPKLKEIYEIVLQANLTAISKVKPGVKAKEIDKAARDYITEAGYGEFFLHRTGHGLGLSVHEEPYITSVNELVLEEGMTFTIEPGIYLEGIGGVRIEDDILVTKDGCRTFTSCLLYTSDAADDMQCVDLGGRRIIKKKFFQAEDGIRDFCLSRGLGDVYKRQQLFSRILCRLHRCCFCICSTPILSLIHI